MDKKTAKKASIGSKTRLEEVPVRTFAASPELSFELQRIGDRKRVPAGSLLFRKGNRNRGVFLVLSGRFALSSGEDPTRVTRIAEKGSLLGLPATVRDRAYSLTAEATTNAEVCVIPAKVFREMLSTSTSLGMTVVSMLAEEVSILRRLAVHQI
ncbi:MAG: Crp/Fnr family transcriptional regulator [Acidobacteriaceae bacterium]